MIKFLTSHILIKASVALIALLLFVFTSYSFLSTRYHTEFYNREFEDKIYDHIDHAVNEINHRSSSMQLKVADLAQMGEMFYRIRESATSTLLEEEIFRYLRESFSAFPYAVGGGLWYEPWTFFSERQYFGPYVYRQENNDVVQTWDLSTPEYDYHTQDWYTIAIPRDWDRQKHRDKEFYWTAPYRDTAGSYAEMITVDAFMHDQSGRIIGIATVDWLLSGLQHFLIDHKVFDSNHILLVEHDSGIVIVNTLNPETVMQHTVSVPWVSHLQNPAMGEIKTANFTIQDVEYRAYYTLTDAGMLYGSMVPKKEIVLPVKELQMVNISMLTVLGFIVLILVLWILVYLLRPIIALTNLVTRISSGDLSTRITVDSSDEIGTLAASFNTMVERVRESQANMKKKIDEKTNELFTVLKTLRSKNDDLERSQLATINLLEDLEEEKKNIENKIIERTNELQMEKNKLLQVTSHMRGGGILFDINHNVIFANSELYKLFNIHQSVPYEKILEPVFKHFGGYAIQDYLGMCFRGQSFHVKEIAGGERIYEIYFHYFAHTTNENLEIPSFFMLIFDITEFKLLEHSKSELISVASHQLRTPLTAMRGNVEMLIDESFGPLNKEQHELLRDIEDSTLRLITMVNDMLDITKIERNDFEMNKSKINIHHLITSVVGDLATYAKQHEVNIHTENVTRDLVIDGDEVRMRQVFQNLIDNAIKYGRHRGDIQISTTRKEEMVEIFFKDNGIGIPPNEQSKIFNRFYRATNTAKSTSSGSGLGLYIVRAIVRQHGGDIRFESVEGEGTTFIVSLPLTMS